MMRLNRMLILAAACSGWNIAGADWQSEQGFRTQQLSAPTSGRAYLERLTATATGITFSNAVPEEKALENSLRADGAGVAAGDVDGDGWCDLFFCGLERPSVLYRNLGNWKFEDVTA